MNYSAGVLDHDVVHYVIKSDYLVLLHLREKVPVDKNSAHVMNYSAGVLDYDMLVNSAHVMNYSAGVLDYDM